MERETLLADAAGVSSTAELAHLLRRLRHRQARRRRAPVVTYRELATRTGWSHGIIGAYLTGKVLPPVDRFDELARQLDATPAELGALATARDRVGEARPVLVPAVAPRHLPAGVAAFVGRTAALAALDAQAGRGPVVISGPAGVGKTALAVHWGHRAAAAFPDGQLFADLGRVQPADVLRGFLTALGVPATHQPAGVEAQVGLYRTLVAGRRILVVLDDVRDAAQARPLLPGTPGGLAVVTSRSHLTGLVAVEGARLLALDPLDDRQARDLLAARLGAHRLAADPAGTAAVLAACRGVPLALAVAAARALTPGDPSVSLGRTA